MYEFGIRVARWNKRAASNSLRSTKAWAKRLSDAEIAAGQIVFSEMESETFPGLVKRVYKRVDAAKPEPKPEVAPKVEAAKPKKQRKAAKPRKQSATRVDRWRRLSVMRTELDRLKQEFAV